MKSCFYLLRHGECEGGNIFRGHWDSPLSAAGYEQMLRACPDLTEFDSIVCSPLKRCYDFALQLQKQQPRLQLQSEIDFIEINFGDWEGQEVEQLMKTQAQRLESFWSNPIDNTPPNGETMIAFNQRVCERWMSMLEQYREKRVLIISHGGVIRCILAKVLGMPLNPVSRLSVPHACLSHIEIFHQAEKPDWPQLISHRPLHSTQ